MSQKTTLQRIMENIPQVAELVDKFNNHNFPFLKITVFNEEKVDDNTISIAMTTHNRVKQLMFTLDTFTKSSIKNIQVVIVDDSNKEVVDPTEFERFDFRIDYIRVEPEDKFWINSCVTYNIAFSRCLGNKVVVQNSEVCHVGDVLKFVDENLDDAKYLVFDVKASHGFKNNEDIYKLPYDYNEYISYCEKCNFIWYQHSVAKNHCFHFLTAITKKRLDDMGGFDLDFAFGACWDDNQFFAKLQKVLKLTVINVCHDKEQMFGIHQFHSKDPRSNKAYMEYYGVLNRTLFSIKTNYYNKHNVWLDFHNITADELQMILEKLIKMT